MKKQLMYAGVFILCMGMLISCSDKTKEKKKETTKETTKTVEKETELDVNKLEIHNNSEDETVKTILKTMLSNNMNPDNIVYNLNFQKLIDKNIVTYKVIEKDDMDYSGKIIGDRSKTKEVYVIVNYKSGKCNFKFTILSEKESIPVIIKSEADKLIQNVDNIRGNITLPSTLSSNKDVNITWTSNSNLITLTSTGNGGEVPPGVVTRTDKDELITLVGNFKYKDFTYTKEYNLNIVKKPEKKEYNAYVYTYFRGNIYGNGESQHIHMAISKDGLFWDAVNKNEPILKANLGTKGVRDSYLVRSNDGDHFYLIGTDLDANGGDWGSYGGNGSRYIRVWESDDLVNWSEERLILIAPENAACMWAPETTYDKTTGEYIVYWSTGLKGGNGKKIWYSKTRDFFTFTEPKIFKDVDNKTTFIDTTITEYNGVVYRFTKNENELSILLETSSSILGNYNLVKTRIADETGVEGPAIYKINNQEKWILYMDGYTGKNAGVGYFPLVASSLADLQSANFVRMKQGEYKMPEGAKHRSFVPVTVEEYNAILNKWGK